MRTGILLSLLLAAASAGAAEDAAIRLRMADIETRLACGATSTDTIYVYGDGWPEPESVALVPCILLSDSGAVLVATPRHPGARAVDSIHVLCSSGKATITRKAGTGADDFVTDPGFSAVILNAVKDEQVRVRLYVDSTFAEFSISSRERQTWREMAYYCSNFGHRTPALPDTAGLHLRSYADMYPRSGGRDMGLTKSADSMPIPDPAPFWKVDVKPRPINLPAPYYPSQLRRDDLEPSAVVAALLDTMGRSRTVVLVEQPSRVKAPDSAALRQRYSATCAQKSTGNRLLDLAAVRAALDASFTPPRLHDKAVRTWVSIPYRFKRH